MTAASRSLKMKKIKQEKNNDDLLCDIVSVSVIMSLAIDIPMITLNPLIVKMDGSSAKAELREPALVDEYVCY